MSVDGRLLELAKLTKRYRGAPNLVFGEPVVLKEICKLFGFKNDCRNGRVFLTDAKVSRLRLPIPTEPLPDWFTNPPASLEQAHASDKAERDAFFEPPAGTWVPFELMSTRARAYACLLALKAGWRIDGRDWSFNEAADTVLVSVQAVGRTFARVQLGAGEVLTVIKERWGQTAHDGAAEVIGV